MTNSHRTPTARTSVQQVLTTARDGLRASREARVARRQLTRDLASYTTIAEVDDLLGSLRGQDESSTHEIRTIVLRNLQDNQRVVGIAS